jgi:hypothetical protein
MSGQLQPHSKRRTKRHDKLVRSLPDDLNGVLHNTHKLEANFSHIREQSEGVSKLAFEHLPEGGKGKHAGHLAGKNLVEHLEATHRHAVNLADSTRGARHMMQPDEIKQQHAHIEKIRSLVGENKNLVAKIHDHLARLHLTLAQLEEMYQTD